MMRLFGSVSGASVTEDNAFSIPTVYSCIRVIAEGVAVLPWHVKKNTAQGSDIDPSHPVYNLLHSEPNPYMSSFMYRELMLTDILAGGNHYSWIEWNEQTGRPIAFWPQKRHEVKPVIYERKLWYQTPAGMIPASDMIHVAGLGFDGISGKSPIGLQAQQLGITLNAQRYGADFFEKGATVGGILTTDNTLKPEQREQLKKTWYDGAHGIGNNHATKVVEGGLKYQRVGVPPEEAQFLETRKLGAVEICGMYRVPPHMVGILDRATFSNIEHQDIGFVKYTLMPWLSRIEQEFNRKVFREEEKGKCYASFNVNGLLKGDITAQTNHIQVMMDRGVYDINMALSFLGQNTIGEDGKRRFVQRNMIPLDRVDDTITAESNKQNGNGKEVL